MAAIGATLVILSAGIDLSVGSILALTVVVVARVLEGPAHAVTPMLPVLALLAGVGVAVLCGAVNGLMVTRLGLVPFVVTLSTMQIFRGAASGLAGETNVYTPTTWINDLMNPVAGNAERAWMLLPPAVWLTLIGGLAVGALLRYTRPGRHIVAVGSNEETARLCGVRVKWVQFGVYAMAGLFGGLAGILQFAYINMGQPTTGVGYELKVIAAVVIGGGSLKGGEGTVAGTLIGALIIGVLFTGCVQMDWPNWLQTVVTGLIIAVAAFIDRLRHREA
jgi:ribose/xylose/arabinose/galactoside ABC-type transport system permease subunit